MRLGLEAVRERLELRRLAPSRARAPARAASPRATGCAAAAARGGTCRWRGRRGSPRSRTAVVPEAGDDPPERLGARIEPRPPGMVLEPCDRAPLPGTSSHSSRTSPIIRRSPATVSCGKRPTPGSDPPWRSTVAAAEQLVAAADGQQRRAAGDGLRDRRPLGDEIGGDQRLLAVLAAADVEEIVLAGVDASPTEMAGTSSSWPRSAARRVEHGDVAAIGVDVEVLGIEVADPDPTSRSQ